MFRFCDISRRVVVFAVSFWLVFSAVGQSKTAPVVRPELALQLGHSLSVFALAYSPDGSTLASGGDDGAVKIWDAHAHELIRTISAHTASVRAVAWSPDGSTLASASDDGTVKFWNAENGKLRRAVAARPAIGNPAARAKALALAYSPDGRALAVGYGWARTKPGNPYTEGELVLLNARNGKTARVLARGGGVVRAVAFSPDGSTLAANLRDKTIQLWNPQSGAAQRVLSGHTGAVTTLAFSPDSKTLASGSGDKTVRLWSVRDGAALRTLSGHTGWVQAVAFSPDGKTLASSGLDHQVLLWNAQSGAHLQTIDDLKHVSRALDFAPVGSTLAVGNWSAVAFFDAKSGAPIANLEERPRWASALCYSPDGKALAVAGGNDRLVLLWNAQSGRLLKTLSGSRGLLKAIAFSSDGKWIAGGSTTGEKHGDNCEILLWRAADGTLVRRLTGHKDTVESLAFSPDGKTLASGAGDGNGSAQRGEIKIWNPQSGALLRSFSGQPGLIKSVAFSPDGQLLASANSGQRDKGVVEVWNPRTGKLLRTLGGYRGWVSSVDFARDGSTLAGAGGDGIVRVWNARSGKFLKSLSHGAWVRGLTFSPDGSTLASGGKDNLIRVWSAKSGKLLRVLRGHEFSIEALTFSPDGRTLASGSSDTSVRIWNAREGRQLAALLTAPPERAERLFTTEPLWLTTTPEGYYDCAEGADYLIKWRFGGKLMPFYHFEETYRRPDLLQRALRGERIAARPLLITRVPPAIRLLALANIPNDPGKMRVLVHAADDAKLPDSNFQFYVNGVLIPDQVALPFAVDGKPIIVDGKPIIVDGKPIVVDGKPIIVDGKPIIVDGKPIVVDGKPITADGRNVPGVQKVSAQNGSTPGVTAAGGDSMAQYGFHRLYVMDIKLPNEEKIVLRAVTTDVEGNKSDDGLTMQRRQIEPTKGDLYVLAIGVGAYRNSLYNISYAASDARSIADALGAQKGRQYANVKTTVLSDAKANIRNIRAALSALKAARPDDTVMVFLSGHGVVAAGKTYFAPWGVFVRDLPGTCLEWSEIVGSLSGLYAKKLLFTDACHSGSKLGSRQATSSQLAEAVRRESGIVMFASSQADEFSFEDKEGKQGAFTLALMEAFEGKSDVDGDGKLTLPELALYVPKRVSTLTKGLQNPQLVLVQDFNPQTVLAKTD